jgi:hypothetical protein
MGAPDNYELMMMREDYFFNPDTGALYATGEGLPGRYDPRIHKSYYIVTNAWFNGTPYPALITITGGYDVTNGFSWRTLDILWNAPKYKKGSFLAQVTSTDPNAYPNDGQKGNNWYVLHPNNAPVITIDPINQSLAAEPGYNNLLISGFVQDSDDNTLELSIDLDGKNPKSLSVSNTAVAKTFAFSYDLIANNIETGTHTITLSAYDARGAPVSTTINILVKALAKDGAYILVGDTVFYATAYSDAENDIALKEEYRYIHDPNYFENSLGAISDSGLWRSPAYFQFAKTGEYIVDVRVQDDPTNGVDQFYKYRSWSDPSLTKLHLYVHRRPIAVLSPPVVYSNGSGGFIVVQNEASYDLDLQSDSTHGIAQWKYSWKLLSDTAWTNGLPPQNIPTNSDFQLQLKVLDKQGVWSSPVIQPFSTKNALPLPAPKAVMTVPNGTQANPTLFATTTPTFKWSQTSTSAGMVFKQFQIIVSDTANRVIFDSGIKPQNTSSTTQSFLMPSNLPAGQALRVKVKVADSNGTWSAWSTETWFYINRSPMGNLTYVTPIYQNDTPSFTLTSNDPDNDALSIKVESRFNLGTYGIIQQWTGVPSGTNKIFTYGPLAARL